MTRPPSGASNPPWLRCGSDSVSLEVLARPGSSQRGILRIESRGVVIGILSPAEKGKANDELVAIVAEIAKVPRAAVSIVRGAGGRTKVVRIVTSNPTVLAEHLAALALQHFERHSSGEDKANS